MFNNLNQEPVTAKTLDGEAVTSHNSPLERVDKNLNYTSIKSTLFFIFIFPS